MEPVKVPLGFAKKLVHAGGLTASTTKAHRTKSRSGTFRWTAYDARFVLSNVVFAANTMSAKFMQSSRGNYGSNVLRQELNSSELPAGAPRTFSPLTYDRLLDWVLRASASNSALAGCSKRSSSNRRTLPRRTMHRSRTGLQKPAANTLVVRQMIRLEVINAMWRRASSQNCWLSIGMARPHHRFQAALGRSDLVVRLRCLEHRFADDLETQ